MNYENYKEWFLLRGILFAVNNNLRLNEYTPFEIHSMLYSYWNDGVKK